MAKKVNFFTVELREIMSSTEHNHNRIKELLSEIIRDNGEIIENSFVAVDLTLPQAQGLHYVADIFSYESNCLFMRLSGQKPSGGFLHRNYDTNIPAALLDGSSEDIEGIEVYTYVFLDYETGIVAIVNQQSAPNHRIINNFFTKYNNIFYLDFKPIPNANGIDRIYNAENTKITQIEVEVPVPDAAILERIFGWSARDILDLQGNSLKATVKLSSVEGRIITDTGEKSKGLIDCMKNGISGYRKAKIRAKADDIKTQDYSFFDENFTYPVEIPTYCIEGGHSRYYTANELVPIYREHLIAAFNNNKEILKAISNR